VEVGVRRGSGDGGVHVSLSEIRDERVGGRRCGERKKVGRWKKLFLKKGRLSMWSIYN
jgi:hypothetical protein